MNRPYSLPPQMVLPRTPQRRTPQRPNIDPNRILDILKGNIKKTKSRRNRRGKNLPPIMGPKPAPMPPRRPVGMQEGGFLGPGDPGFDPMGAFEAPSEESIAAAELAVRRAELERLGTIGMDTNGDGFISRAERNAAIGAGPSVTTTNETSRFPLPGEPGFDPMAGVPTEEEIRAAQAANAPINYTIDPSLDPLQNLYGQVGAAGEEEARSLINAILAADYGQLSSAQRDLIGSGLYRRIANRLGMTDAAGNPITALSTVKMTGDDGREVTPSAQQSLDYLSGMEGLDQGAGIDLLLNFLQGRVRPPSQQETPPTGPFGTYNPYQQQPPSGQPYNPYQQYYNFMMPQPPQFGQPYMSQSPFLPYAGMANPMNPSIFGGYGYGYGPSQNMAPMPYYGGFQPLPDSVVSVTPAKAGGENTGDNYLSASPPFGGSGYDPVTGRNQSGPTIPY